MAVLALSASAVAIGCLTPIPAFAQQEDASPAASPLKKSNMTAGEVLDGVKNKLDGLDSLSCQIHQTVLMSGRRLHAAGRYFHASGNRLRLEYRLYPVRATKAADKETMALDAEPENTEKLKVTGSLTQVSDGSVLSTYWVNADQKQLTRRNIREIVEAADAEPNYSSASSLADLGVGGMQTLMAQLQSGMEFGGVLEQETKAGKKLVLTGKWSAKTRKDVFQLPDDPNAPLPAYVPDYVRVYISADTMLPARIQYLKKFPNPEVKKVQPLATLDFRSFVTNPTLPEDTFVFTRPEGEDITEIDLTSQVIENIKKVAEGASNTTPETDPPAGK